MHLAAVGVGAALLGSAGVLGVALTRPRPRPPPPTKGRSVQELFRAFIASESASGGAEQLLPAAERLDALFIRHIGDEEEICIPAMLQL